MSRRRAIGWLARALGLAEAAALTAAGAACGPSRARMLQGEIAQAVQTSPGHVDLASLFPARWDRVCILVPGVGGRRLLVPAQPPAAR